MEALSPIKQKGETFFENPIFLPTVLFVSVILLIKPWGNYPTNDDWVYAHLVKQFVEHGKIATDTPYSATAIGQVLFASPFVKIFGFSHVLLRVLTLFLSWLGLYAIHKLMNLAGVKKQIQVFSLALLVFNPLFLNLSASFMTEIYGYVPAFWIAVLWFSERRRRIKSAEMGNEMIPVISWKVAVMTGILAGNVYWIRQTGILVLPALLGASLLNPLFNKNWRCIAASLPRLTVSALLSCLTIASYFLFVKSAGNDPGELSRNFHSLTTFNALNWILHVGMVSIYMAAFFYPLLLLSSLKYWDRHRPTALEIILLCAYACLFWVMWTPSQDSVLIPIISKNPQFRYFENIVHAGGVGPVQLNDFFQLRIRLRPKWSEMTLNVVRSAILFVPIFWIPFMASLFRFRENKKELLASEILGFGCLFSLGSFCQLVQLFQQSKEFDRYLFPVFLGLLIMIAIALSRALDEQSPTIQSRPKWVDVCRFPSLFILSLLPLAFYSVAGVHDYFRWDDARWKLFNQAVASGISPKEIDGGYEVSCWRDVEMNRDSTLPVVYDWNNQNPTVIYRICMNKLGHCEIVWKEGVSYWLAKGPPVVLTRRQ